MTSSEYDALYHPLLNISTQLDKLQERVDKLEESAVPQKALGGWTPHFTIADRDARIHGLEMAFAFQSEHYQKELDKARDRVGELQGKLAESERWSLVLKRLYYDELAKNGRFECCCCGEVASDGAGHKCEGKG